MPFCVEKIRAWCQLTQNCNNRYQTKGLPGKSVILIYFCLFWKSLVPGVSSLKIGGLRRKQQFLDEIDNGALCPYLLPKIPHK